jgi:hypothetical protein
VAQTVSQEQLEPWGNSSSVAGLAARTDRGHLVEWMNLGKRAKDRARLTIEVVEVVVVDARFLVDGHGDRPSGLG